MAEVAGDEAGMQRVGCHARSHPGGRELVGEENIGKLRFAVDAEGEVAAAVRTQVVEGDVGAQYAPRKRRARSRRRAALAFSVSSSRLASRETGREAVERERHLDARRRLTAVPEEDCASVVDEYVQALVTGAGKLSRRRERRTCVRTLEIGDQARRRWGSAGLSARWRATIASALAGLRASSVISAPALGQHRAVTSPMPRGSPVCQADTPSIPPPHSPRRIVPCRISRPSPCPPIAPKPSHPPFRILAEARRETPEPMKRDAIKQRRWRDAPASPARLVAYWAYWRASGAHLVSPESDARGRWPATGHPGGDRNRRLPARRGCPRSFVKTDYARRRTNDNTASQGVSDRRPPSMSRAIADIPRSDRTGRAGHGGARHIRPADRARD